MLLASIALALASNTFTANGAMPPRTSCYTRRTRLGKFAGYSTAGPGVSPELHWSEVPQNTRSYALIVTDRERPGTTQWVVYNIPATVQSFPEGVTLTYQLGAIGMSSWGLRYFGPCPPFRQTHHYLFMMYVLDVPRIGPIGLSAPAVIRAMRGHIIGRGMLTGVFRAP